MHMKILKTQTLRGANYWSIRYKKLIVARLALEELTDQPSNEIPGFYEGLIKTLPSLVEHFCSPGCRGGFLMRVQEGTMLGHIVEHVALELQTLAGMPVGFGRTRETSEPGVYQVVFEYQDEQAGRYAARAAVRLCQSIIDRGDYSSNELEQDLKDLRELSLESALGPSTDHIVAAARQRNIPWVPLSVRSIIQLGYGVHQKRIQASLSSFTNILGVELASDKEGTKRILQESGLPVPKGVVIYYRDDLAQAIEDVGGFPLVIKPLDGNHGRGIGIDLMTLEQAEEAYEAASDESRTKAVIVERFYTGRDHRILVINGKVVAVAERVPAHVIGNGTSTIQELVDETNRDPLRGSGHDNVLTAIELDRPAFQQLERQGYSLETVLQTGAIAYLKATANLSTGGIAIDRTDVIHPTNVWIAERAARIIGLDIAGIDLVIEDIARPMKEVDGVIVEVNAAPGLRMHFSPSQGSTRNVGEAIVEMLFPPGSPSRVPIVAVTGTNGKTTTNRLIAHIFKQTGQIVGYTTTDGIYIGEFLVEQGDTTGPQSAQVILQDPTVEVAVLETARGGLLRSGLGFDQCDVGVVLNIAADHLGIGDIDTVDDLAHLKSVVVESASSDGYAVLNADDALVVAMAKRTKSQIAYFSMNPENPVLKRHIEQGGLAAVYEDGYLCLLKGDWRLRIERADAVPLTMGGRAPFMIANALAAALAAFAQGVPIEAIRQALATFKASANQTPGRMNLFNLGTFHALVDYAHNPHSYEALGGFVRNWDGERIGVIGGPGDRRDEDFITLGRLSAAIFDRIIVKEDDDTRGRPRGDAAALIAEGIRQIQPNLDCRVILDEAEAIQIALECAPEKSLVVILPETVKRAIATINARHPIPEAIADTSAQPASPDAPAPIPPGEVGMEELV